MPDASVAAIWRWPHHLGGAWHDSQGRLSSTWVSGFLPSRPPPQASLRGLTAGPVQDKHPRFRSRAAPAHVNVGWRRLRRRGAGQGAARSLKEPTKQGPPCRLASPQPRSCGISDPPPRIPLGLPSPVGNHECPVLGSCSTAVSQLRASVIAIRERGQ